MTPVEFTFLMCSERSGSNFITTLMGGHPAICAPPPSHLFRLFVGNAPNYGDLNRDENWEVLLADVMAAFENQLGVWDTAPAVAYLRSQAQARTIAEPLRLIYEQEARHHNAAHVFIKENHTAQFAERLTDLFEPCRFVFMVRDPRDVAASYLATDGIPGGVARAVEVWKKDQTANQSFREHAGDTDRLSFARYEDLIAEPRLHLSRLAAHLGLDFDPGMLAAHQRDEVRRNAERIDAWANLAKPVIPTNAGKFKSILSHAEIEFVELSCYELMDAFGYIPEFVSENPDATAREARMAELAPELREGTYRFEGEEEEKIRRGRLAVIDTVLGRRLPN